MGDLFGGSILGDRFLGGLFWEVYFGRSISKGLFWEVYFGRSLFGGIFWGGQKGVQAWRPEDCEDAALPCKRRWRVDYGIRVLWHTAAGRFRRPCRGTGGTPV